MTQLYHAELTYSMKVQTERMRDATKQNVKRSLFLWNDNLFCFFESFEMIILNDVIYLKSFPCMKRVNKLTTMCIGY